MMDEVDAQDWVRRNFSDAIHHQLSDYVSLLLQRNVEQNLIAPSTVPVVWSRHIVDSLQLLWLAPAEARNWLDIGSGAGLPGIPIAIARRHHVTLSEPRGLRVTFLAECVRRLGIERMVTVEPRKAQFIGVAKFDVISARAVANSGAIFEMTMHLADQMTTYILPKGISAANDMLSAKRNWSGTFHVERSAVDPASGIIVAKGVRRK